MSTVSFKFTCTGCRKEINGAAPELVFLEFDDHYDQHEACSKCYRQIREMNDKREAAIRAKEDRAKPKQKATNPIRAKDVFMSGDEDSEQENEPPEKDPMAALSLVLGKLGQQMATMNAGIQKLVEKSEPKAKPRSAASKAKPTARRR